MKTFQKISFKLAFLTLFCTAGCREKDVYTLGDLLGDKNSVNEWVYATMQDGYFWYKEMPAQSKLDARAEPDAYFENLVFNRKTHDRFSMITPDFEATQQQFNGVTKAFGIHYMLGFIDSGKSNIAAFLSHVSNGSPAQKAGLQRGDIIIKVNGTQLTEDNYAELLSAESIRVTMGKLNGEVIESAGQEVSLTRGQIAESPIAFSKIITKQNRKIGYLVYTQFVPGTDADKVKYDNELRNIFADFGKAGIQELVLDLRLNGGGYLSSAVTLGSLIVSNYSASKVFYKEQWNDKYIKYWQEKNGADALTYKFANEPSNIGNRLNRVFVLTSNGTASASELIINGLKPHMSVITIGDNTAGKNLFGSLIGDEKKRWKYGLYVMLGQTVNANGDSDYGTVDGITPTQAIDDSNVPFLPFGDENETLLHAALTQMGVTTGNPSRMAGKRQVQRTVRQSLRDTPAAWNGLMIRDNGEALPLPIQ